MKKKIVLGLATLCLSVTALCSFTMSKDTSTKTARMPQYKNVICNYTDSHGNQQIGAKCIPGTGLLCENGSIVCAPSNM